MANMALGTGMGAVLKMQFANPRARLMPSFRTAHLVATGGLVCAVLAAEAAMAPSVGQRRATVGHAQRGCPCHSG